MKIGPVVVYADFSEIALNSGEYLTELTWVIEDEDYQALVPHHYFISYPGDKESERLLTEVIGGTPLVRYSPGIVLKTFFDSLPKRSIIAFKDLNKKEKFRDYLNSDGIHGMLGSNAQKSLCLYDDVAVDESEKAFVDDIMDDIRREAAGKFGNSL